MKKTVMLCLLIICMLAMPLTCFAAEPNAINSMNQNGDQVLLATGYTEDGVYYEVYGEEITVSPNARLSLQVERTVVYDGRVLPPASIYWQEEIGGFTFRGTLYIDSSIYEASTNKTTAIYVGTISN